MAQDHKISHRGLCAKLNAILDVTSRHALRGIIIDHLPMEGSRLPLVEESASSGVISCVTLVLSSRTPFRVWRWMTDFVQRCARASLVYWRGLKEIQASLSIDSCVLAEIGELVKKCCSVENRFTFQIARWGIFYHNGDSLHFHRLKTGDVPVNVETRWNKKRTGITMCGLNLNGAQITTSTLDNRTSTTLRSTGPPSKGHRNYDELHISIPIEELKGVENSSFHAAKVVEVDGISLVVRSVPRFVVPPKSFLKEISQDRLQKILQMTKPVLDLKSKRQLLVEYWKGVSQMEMIECRNKVIIQFQNLPASEIFTFNGAHSLRFIPMCPSSKNKEYWQRALHELSEDHLSKLTGSSSQSSTVHSTRGRIKFLLGEFDHASLDFDRALLDFDRGLLDSDRALNSNTDGLASTLLDRTMVKCVLARYPEATQDINMAAVINPNSSDIKRFQACLEDILFMDSFKSSTPLLQPTQPVYDLLTGDHYPNLDSPRYYRKMPPLIKSMEEFRLSSIPDWTEVREPPKDLPELDLQQGASHNHDFPQSLLLDYLNVYHGLTGYDSLCTGEKLAEGGQAEIFEALGTPPRGTQTNLVLKVFKQAFPLQTWLQPDVLQFGGVYLDHPSPALCTALGVKFLNDGRCAFVFPRHWGDLRRLIHQQTVTPSPFEFSTSVKIMLQIAEGMRSLHIRNILHRDLKASNILVTGDNPAPEDFRCMVADFECSVGVMGTGFWRAPEILTQFNRQTFEPKALTWSKEADVYSFGMTCYEIITGDTPFQNLKASDWDVVLSGGRPRLPLFLDSKLRTLIELCWHADPEERPNFLQICKVLADVKGEQC